MHLIDLAGNAIVAPYSIVLYFDKVLSIEFSASGSERVKKSKAAGERLKEAVGINYSLLVLGKVITSLVESKSHVPYFESKLTTMLKAAFGGNSKTTAIINCRPDDLHGDETLQSLRFGERCGMISNNVKSIAASVTDTLVAIDRALELVQEQLKSLELRDKTHLESYSKLVRSYNYMRLRRDLLIPSDTIDKSSGQIPEAH